MQVQRTSIIRAVSYTRREAFSLLRFGSGANYVKSRRERSPQMLTGRLPATGSAEQRRDMAQNGWIGLGNNKEAMAVSGCFLWTTAKTEEVESEGTEGGRPRKKKVEKESPLDRNRAGDLSVSINSFTAERDSQLHHKGICLRVVSIIQNSTLSTMMPRPASRHLSSASLTSGFKPKTRDEMTRPNQ